MSATRTSICVVLAITSDTAFIEVKGTPSLLRAYDSLTTLFPTHAIVAIATPKDAPTVREFLESKNATFDLLISETFAPSALATALEHSVRNVESVLIHDASRPLTPQAQFESVLTALDAGIDAVRPALAFTETLKILDAGSVIKRTLERSTVLRISAPELIRVSAIDINGADCGWFLPLKKDARTLHVEGSPDGLRLNTVEDRDLLELSVD